MCHGVNWKRDNGNGLLMDGEWTIELCEHFHSFF